MRSHFFIYNGVKGSKVTVAFSGRYFKKAIRQYKKAHREVAEARPGSSKYVPSIYAVQNPQVWQKARTKLQLSTYSKITYSKVHIVVAKLAPGAASTY